MMNEQEQSELINSLLGRPYELGASGPDKFDCYGLARYLQSKIFGLDLPLFKRPASGGRRTLALAIASCPERDLWQTVPRPEDGCMVSMARQNMGYHLGTYLALDRGIIVHTLEGSGVTVDKIFTLKSSGWRRLIFYRYMNAQGDSQDRAD